MLNTIIIGGLFIGALIYLGNLIFGFFSKKTSCAKGCGSCAADLKKMEKEGF